MEGLGRIVVWGTNAGSGRLAAGLRFCRNAWEQGLTMNGATDAVPVAADTAVDSRPVKLASRNVWKLFGSDAGSFIRRRNGVATTAELQQAGLVGAVRAVDLEIRQGEIFIIMGLSGSGKSTLVRCLSR